MLGLGRSLVLWVMFICSSLFSFLFFSFSLFICILPWLVPLQQSVGLDFILDVQFESVLDGTELYLGTR